jgi:hypothetical protein
MLNETALTVARNSLQRLKEINAELANISMDLGTAMVELEITGTVVLPLENAIGAITETIENSKAELLEELARVKSEESTVDEANLYSTIEDELMNY